MRLTLLPQTLRGLITASFIVVVLLLSVPTTVYVTQQHANQLIKDRGAHLHTLAQATAVALAANLGERLREVQLLAQTPTYTHGPLDSPELDASLKRVSQSYPHYSWISLVALDGTVLHATDGMLVGESVAERPWFKAAAQGAYVGDLHEAVLLGKLLRAKLHDWPIRFLDFAAPVFDAQGQLRAVLGTHVHWRWVKELVETLKPLGADRDGIEVFIINQANMVIYPDQAALGAGLPTVPRVATDQPYGFADWDEQVSYLTAAASVAETPGGKGAGLGWKVVVRQPRTQVLSEVMALQTVVVAMMLGSTLVFGVVAWRLGKYFSHPIAQLAQKARQIAQGEEDISFNPATRSIELRVLSDSMVSMAATLLERKHALESINRHLETMVADRTAALEAANRELASLARKDALTGLPNRLAANERLQLEFLQMKRSRQPYALLMMDIDFFKKINDTHGHAAGDEVLRHVAHLLITGLRESDFVGRVGGEEFLVLLPRTELAAAVAVAEKLRALVGGHPIEPAGRVTISVGIVVASPEHTNEDIAVRLADDLLYQAKEGGRNRAVSAFSTSPPPSEGSMVS